ncbi:MAG: helix-turn-helix domain-containing protein [Bacteroidetes bacterium]|nr:helix-turn-helix domain-containing protein [Bacteroidota bacterium]
MIEPKSIQVVTYTPEQFGDLVKESVRAALQAWEPPKKMKSDLPEYLTRQQTAKLLQISLVTLHEWTKKGVVQARRIQGRIRFDRAEVERALTDVKHLKYKCK